jgi:hypothetical protein
MFPFILSHSTYSPLCHQRVQHRLRSIESRSPSSFGIHSLTVGYDDEHCSQYKTFATELATRLEKLMNVNSCFKFELSKRIGVLG